MKASRCPSISSSTSHPTRAVGVQLLWQMLTRGAQDRVYQTSLAVLPYLRLQSAGDNGLSQLCLREVDMDLTSVGKDSVASCGSSSLSLSAGHSEVLGPSSGTAAQEQTWPLFRKRQSASP